MADPNLWCPLPDGTSVALFLDRERTVAHLRENGFSERRHPRACSATRSCSSALRQLLRGGPPAIPGWAPRRPAAELEELLGHDQELISVVFEESIAETLDRYVDDERHQARALRPGRDRRLRGSPRPRHRLGQADAPPGRPARARIVLGLRRGRHGPGLVRDRASGAGERRRRSPPECRWRRSSPARGSRSKAAS